MNDAGSKRDKLVALIRVKEEELCNLRAELASLNDGPPGGDDQVKRSNDITSLDLAEYKRYGRQMILREIGLPNQVKLRNASVLIVGLGGLGCPAAAYLAGAGVGRIGLVDGDKVELSNLHRQILHSTDTIGAYKVDSAAEFIRRLNPNVQCDISRKHLDAGSALDVFSGYDLVLDCTDHPAVRYLISDAAVCSGIPIVSAAALKTDGQLVVLNNPPFHPSGGNSGPCYRCVNPKPPPADSVVSCGEGGILGPVVGTMGVLMATEAIKIIASPPFPYCKSSVQVSDEGQKNASMLIYSAFSSTPFRSIKLRGRKSDCPVCSSLPEHRSITADTLKSNSLDYAAFCGSNQPLSLLQDSQRLTPLQMRALSGESKALGDEQRRALVLDVRDSTQFGIYHLPNSINIPIQDLEASDFDLDHLGESDPNQPIVVVCRFGNDSQVAVRGMLQNGRLPSTRPLFDLKGGLERWRTEVDPSFPEY